LYNMLPESCFIALSLALHEKMVANLFFLPGPPRP
jgi:hypothetical protein